MREVLFKLVVLDKTQHFKKASWSKINEQKTIGAMEERTQSS